jgi:hypothetical protein
MYAILDARNKRIIFTRHEPAYLVGPLVAPQPEGDRRFPSWPLALEHARSEAGRQSIPFAIWDDEIGKLLTIVYEGEVWARDANEFIPT